MVVVTPHLHLETSSIELGVGLSGHLLVICQCQIAVYSMLCHRSVVQIHHNSQWCVWCIGISLVAVLTLAIVPHLNHEWPGQKSMIHLMEVFLANTIDAHHPGYSCDGVIIWFAVWRKAIKLMASCCHFSVIQWEVAWSHPHFACSVIDMIDPIFIIGWAFPMDDVTAFHVIHYEPPHQCVAIVPQFESEPHLMPSLNAIFYHVIHLLHNHPAAVSRFQHHTILFHHSTVSLYTKFPDAPPSLGALAAKLPYLSLFFSYQSFLSQQRQSMVSLSHTRR